MIPTTRKTTWIAELASVVRASQLVIAIGVALLIVLIATGMLQFLLQPISASSPLEFHAEEWRADKQPALSLPYRLRMAQSLVDSNQLIGLSATQVEGLLGPPSEWPARTTWMSSKTKAQLPTGTAQWMRYYLGVVWIDDVNLLIGFGAEQKVNVALLVR